MHEGVCGCVSKQGCNALIWCLATGRQTCNIFYLPCHRRVAPLQCSLCAHNFCLRCTISRAPHDPPPLSRSLPALPAKRGASLNATSKNQCNPKAARASLFVCLVPLFSSSSAESGRVYYKIHLHRVPYVRGWEEAGVRHHYMCSVCLWVRVCVWVGVNRRRAVLLDCCK